MAKVKFMVKAIRPPKMFGAWWLEPAALKEVVRIWGIDLKISPAERSKDCLCRSILLGEVFEGDLIALLIRERHKEIGYNRPPQLDNGDPVEETYRYLERKKYQVLIPAS